MLKNVLLLDNWFVVRQWYLFLEVNPFSLTFLMLPLPVDFCSVIGRVSFKQVSLQALIPVSHICLSWLSWVFSMRQNVIQTFTLLRTFTSLSFFFHMDPLCHVTCVLLLQISYCCQHLWIPSFFSVSFKTLDKLIRCNQVLEVGDGKHDYMKPR